MEGHRKINKGEDDNQSNVSFIDKYYEASGASPEDIAEFEALAKRLPALPNEPHETLLAITDFLRKEKFTFDETSLVLHDVLKNKSGNCLSLSLLVGALLETQGKVAESKILIHLLDHVSENDKRLFRDLYSGGAISYDNPQLPNFDEQPTTDLQDNRFVLQDHPIIILNGIPLDTTMATLKDELNPLIETRSETSLKYSLEELNSFLYSDRAKGINKRLHDSVEKNEKDLVDLYALIQESLALVPNNRDALQLLWQYGEFTKDNKLKKEAVEKLKQINTDDSDLNYRLWLVTGEVSYLNKSLEKFPENIRAFIDKKVFLEKDPKEARANLAIVLWCVYYSKALSLKDYTNDPMIKEKMKELFPEQFD